MNFRSTNSEGFVPPPYPYDRLGKLKALAASRYDDVIDLSIGTPVDPPPPFLPSVLATSRKERGYPPSFGSQDFREAASAWLRRSFGVDIAQNQVGATIGSKEFIVGLPGYLRLRDPSKSTVLYPETSYSSYEMGAILSGCNAVAVPQNDEGVMLFDRLDKAIVDDALMLWVNSPSNPTGSIGGMAEAAQWTGNTDVVLASDECYCDFYWESEKQSILKYRTKNVLAVHSLSKRSNLAGLRVGTYSGDRDLVGFISEIRKHSGMMVPGPIQVAATQVFGDEAHVQVQRSRYRERLEILAAAFKEAGFDVSLPKGGFYLWFAAPEEVFADGFALAEWLAENAGLIVSPGEFYGPSAARYIRVAMVATTSRIQMLADRVVGLSL